MGALRGFQHQIVEHLQSCHFGSILEDGKEAVELALKGDSETAAKKLESLFESLIEKRRVDIIASMSSKDAKAVVQALCMKKLCPRREKSTKDGGLDARLQIIHHMGLSEEVRNRVVSVLQQPREMSTLAVKLNSLNEILPRARKIASGNLLLTSNLSSDQPNLNAESLVERVRCDLSIEWIDKPWDHVSPNSHQASLSTQFEVQVPVFVKQVTSFS